MKLNNSGYKIIGKRKILNVKKMRVDMYKIRLPNGNEAEWVTRDGGDLFIAVPIRDKKVYMTKEWRLGPQKIVTQFTRSHANMDHLQKELREELGLIGGKYKKLVDYKFSRGNRVTGFNTIYVMSNFEFKTPNRDENEIQEIVKLPIKNLYSTLSGKHVVDAETLLVAKLVEEKYK